MAGILSSPALAQIPFFGEALQPGRGGVIAVLLVVAFAAGGAATPNICAKGTSSSESESDI